MNQWRYLTSGVLVLILFGLWVGCGEVKETKREPVVKWTPASATQPKSEPAQKLAPPQVPPAPPPPAPTPAEKTETSTIPPTQASPSPVFQMEVQTSPAGPGQVFKCVSVSSESSVVSPPDSETLPPEIEALLLEGTTPGERAKLRASLSNKFPQAPVEKSGEAAGAPLVKEVWPPAGPEVLNAIVSVLSQEKESGLGFRPNDLVLGKVFENGTNRQKGELAASQDLLKLILGQVQPAEAAGQVRATLLLGNLEKWWFPSAEKTLDQGIKALQGLAQAVKAGKVTLSGEPMEAKKLIEECASLLSREVDALSGHTLSFSEQDNVFFHAQGVSILVKEVLTGARSAYATAVENRGADKDLAQAVKWLDRATAMKPWIVLNADLDDYRSNHLLLLAWTLERAKGTLKEAGEKLH